MGFQKSIFFSFLKGNFVLIDFFYKKLIASSVTNLDNFWNFLTPINRLSSVTRLGFLEWYWWQIFLLKWLKYFADLMEYL